MGHANCRDGSPCTYESSLTEANLEPSYEKPSSYLKASAAREAFSVHCEPVDSSCSCGVDDNDADEFQAGPIFPELGSYIKKRPKQRSGALQQTHYPEGQWQQLVRSSSLPGLIPVKSGLQASAYVPCAGDEIDLEVKRNLANLEEDVSQELFIHRKRAAEYIIDGRQVRMYWGGQRGTFGQGPQQLYVHEAVAGTSDTDDVLLAVYLEQVSHVLSSTKTHIAANMTFVVTGMDTDLAKVWRGSCTSKDRNRAMVVACNQAKLRSDNAQDQLNWNIVDWTASESLNCEFRRHETAGTKSMVSQRSPLAEAQTMGDAKLLHLMTAVRQPEIWRQLVTQHCSQAPSGNDIIDPLRGRVSL